MTEEQLFKYEPLEDLALVQLAKDLSESNDPNYNFLKLAEELNELSELLLKAVNKYGTDKVPSKEEIADEIADVVFRSMIVDDQLGTQEYVNGRIRRKAARLKQLLDEGKYKGRI